MVWKAVLELKYRWSVGGPASCKEAAKRCTELNWAVGPTLKLEFIWQKR
jgi:hypothetical protein